MDALVSRYFGRSPSRFTDVKNKEKALFTPEATPIARAAAYAAEDADTMLRLWQALKPRMAAEQVVTVYETLERPMPRVLARMEERGISVDPAVLARLSNEFGKKQTRARGRHQQDRRDAGQRRLAQADSATFCSARWACRAAARPRPVSGRRPRASSRISPNRATSCRARSSTGARCRSCARPTPRRCRITSTRRRTACTRAMRWRRPRPAGCRRPSRICRTSRSAPRTAARSARPSSPRPA